MTLPGPTRVARLARFTRLSGGTATAVPVAALATLAASWGSEPAGLHLALVALAIVGAVIVGVHHAEALAHRFGEPYGTVLLAVSVTIIEAGLVVSLMVTEGQQAASLARDTVFAAVMIAANGVVGLSVVVGSARFGEVRFSPQGTNGLLATLATLTALTLVLPTFTTSSPGPTFSSAQLAFSATACLAVYAVFVFVQTVQDRQSFLPVSGGEERGRPGGLAANLDVTDERERGPWWHLALLIASLMSVVGLAKTSSGAIESFVDTIGATPSAVGVAIALVVLLPETVAAVRAARRNEMQTSLNLALGSGLASIGLTVPAVAVAVSTPWVDGPLLLGLGSKEIVLMVLTFGVGATTLASGRANLLHGTVHLSIVFAFVFLAIEP